MKVAFLAPGLWGALVVGTLLGVTGCAPSRAPTPERTVKIGFSQDSLVLERWQRDLEAFRRAARDLGATVDLKVADQDAGVQEAQIRDLAAGGIDVLVVVANDAERLSAVVREVKARGIPVVCYDRLVRQAGADLYISFDNEKVGSLMAQAVLGAVPRGGYLVINGAKTDHNAAMINTGFHRVLDPAVASGAVTIVAEIWPQAWDNNEVRAALEGLLPRVGQIRGVVAGDDMLADEAIRFFSENGRTGLVQVAGQDAELAACQRIVEGTQLATIYKPVDRLALKAAAFAVMLANHEAFQTDGTIDDGRGPVPYVRLEPVAVTRENLRQTVIADGFQRERDVYKNLDSAP